MQIILLERVEKLGQMGDTVNVKPGYARNFLLPKGKALRATKENIERFENEKAQLEARNIELRSEAEKVAKKMDNTTVVLVRQAGESGQLYGSVNARDVADELDKAGFTINRSQVRLTRPIKALGLHEVAVSVHPEVSVNIFANVARSLEESEVQAKTGKAVLSSAEAEVREQIEITESSLSNAAEAVAKHADEIFEKGALENAIVEAETLVKQEDATILIPENGDTEDANAVKTSEDGDVDPDPKE
ncbi:MAG: 50S ribosomal protein L9 [Magnetovibrio sp.]|nr:50S ribosomal protein L9 [Magnetovibrio sp.]|tara:strand:+ start:1955 stop:2695 length:741 start_codon:yes stop_codon:yes gene_type:complete